ncbi:hypothetical protein GGF42_003203 [Coemansia sp. RSA 2424]|nr:hypothetical protein GGF42_003203 [Coemansia sp. RSA 2424]
MSMRIPGNITDCILAYLEERQRLTGIDFSVADFYKRVYAPLLSLNQEWRAATMKRLAKECVITVAYPAVSLAASYSNAPQLFTPEHYHMSVFVRTVTLRLNIEGILSGEVPQLLAASRCLINSFTHATILNVELYTSDVIVGDYDAKKVLDAVGSTASTIKRAMPMARTISIKDNMLHPIIGSRLSTAFGHFMQQLFAGSAKSALSYSSFIDDTAKYSSLSALTHIEYDLKGGSKRHMQIINLNAASLQGLSVDFKVVGQIGRLFEDNAGIRYVYPNLRRLKLSSTSGMGVLSHLVFEAYAPFPNLSHADMQIDYPFGDDTLFRGNAATLETLYITVNPRVEKILDTYDVFSGSKHKHLRSVTFEMTFAHYEPGPDMSSRRWMRIISSLPSVAKLGAIGVLVVSEILPQLSCLAHFRLIRVLDLKHVFISLSNIVDLLNDMAQLNALSCMCSLLTAEVPYGELGAYLKDLRAEHYPLAKQLKVLNFWEGIGKPVDSQVDNIVNCIASLAVLCPSFFPAQMDPRLAVKYNKSLRYAMDTDVFFDYSTRLYQLLIAKI